MVNMKMEPGKDKYNMVAEAKSPEYPYGLKIHLNYEALMKLGIKELPEVGKEIKISAVAYVCDTSENESEEYGENKSMSLQITDMDLGKSKDKKDKVLKETNIQMAHKFYSQDDKDY